MIPKFKIGDKVKTLKGGYIGKEYIIEKIGFNYYKDELVYSGSGSDFYDYELELVSTSEQLAVEKFKEELKDKINKLIKKLEKSLVKLTNTDRAYQQGKIEQLRELLKFIDTCIHNISPERIEYYLIEEMKRLMKLQGKELDVGQSLKKDILNLKKSDTRFKDNQIYNQAIDDVLNAL